MPVWEYFKNRGLLPSGGATGACRPPTGRQGPICKKNNYLWTPEGVGGRSPIQGATGVRTKQT